MERPPALQLELVREFVIAGHGNLDRVTEMLVDEPALRRDDHLPRVAMSIAFGRATRHEYVHDERCMIGAHRLADSTIGDHDVVAHQAVIDRNTQEW